MARKKHEESSGLPAEVQVEPVVVEPVKVEEKVVDPEVLRRSVIDLPGKGEAGARTTRPLLFFMASVADTVPAWGIDVMARDLRLREFFPTEPILLSAIYSASVRNASFDWEVVPVDPRRDARNTVRASKAMLENVDYGRGFQSLILKTCIDLYTQDNGAFWELIRRENRPDSPVISINYLDSQKCTRTGNPQYPVIYQDRLGKYKTLSYYHVVTLEEMPSPVEEMYNVQYSALSRALRAAQILKSILVYKDEKVSGRFSRAMDFISGVSRQDIEDAIKIAEENSDNLGLTKFSSPNLVPGLDPTNPVSHVRVDFASLPDNFVFDDEMKWYVAILAMAFGVDYQEFAPLPGGSLGSGQQSEILHLKTRGKGPATVMKLIEHGINHNALLPRIVRFSYKVHDARAEEERANARFLRGKDRALRINSGELDAVAARYLAMEDGDLPEWIADGLEARGVEATPRGGPVVPPEEGEPDANPSGGMTETGAGQIETGIESRFQRRDWQTGGMRGIKPDSPLPDMTEEMFEEARAEARKLLGIGAPAA